VPGLLFPAAWPSARTAHALRHEFDAILPVRGRQRRSIGLDAPVKRYTVSQLPAKIPQFPYRGEALGVAINHAVATSSRGRSNGPLELRTGQRSQSAVPLASSERQIRALMKVEGLPPRTFSAG